MKKLLLALILLPALSFGQWESKFDLNLDAQAIGLRNLNDGEWLAGIGKKIWHLDYNTMERFHVGVFQAWRASRGDPAFGLSAGFTTGKLGDYAYRAIRDGMPNLAEHVSWIPRIGNLISVETFAGYRPKHAVDVHSWVYGFGMYLNIPFEGIGLP